MNRIAILRQIQSNMLIIWLHRQPNARENFSIQFNTVNMLQAMFAPLVGLSRAK